MPDRCAHFSHLLTALLRGSKFSTSYKYQQFSDFSPFQLALQIFSLFLSALESNPGFELFGFPVLGGVEGGVSGLLASTKQLGRADLGWLFITENYNDKTNKLAYQNQEYFHIIKVLS